LLVEGERMGKSLGNFYTLRDLVRMRHNPLVVRYLLMSTHYRTQLNFTFKGLEAAKNALRRLYDFMDRLEEVKNSKGEDVRKLVEKARKDFENAMDDDLDVSKALATVFNLVREVNTLIDQKKLGRKGAKQVKDLMMDFDKVLAFLGGFWKRKEEKLSKEVEDLIKMREEARRAKDWKTADVIRNKLREMGIILEDTPEGVKWKKALTPD